MENRCHRCNGMIVNYYEITRCFNCGWAFNPQIDKSISSHVPTPPVPIMRDDRGSYRRRRATIAQAEYRDRQKVQNGLRVQAVIVQAAYRERKRLQANRQRLIEAACQMGKMEW